jgi:hypothetical protein
LTVIFSHCVLTMQESHSWENGTEYLSLACEINRMCIP